MQLTRTLLVQSQPRRYHVIEPPSLGNPRSAIIFLHGTGGTPSWAAEETQLNRFANDQGVLLLLPEGLPALPDERINFLRNPPRWNDGSTHVGQTEPLQQDDVAFLDAMMDDAGEEYAIDPSRIVMAGFSNGAGMTFRFAAERPGRLAAIVPVAGHCWVAESRILVAVPTLYIVGMNDPLIPFNGGLPKLPWPGVPQPRPSVLATLQQWADILGISADAVEVSQDDGTRRIRFPGTVPFEALFIEGLGHHWPGGLGQLNQRIAGPYRDVVDANTLLGRWLHELGIIASTTQDADNRLGESPHRQA